MNRLNIFNFYRNFESNHENILTRNFLILIKNIPLIQTMFFSMIEKEIGELTNFPAAALGDLSIEKIDTQKSSNYKQFRDELEGRRLVSVIISDDRLETEIAVEASDRRVIYKSIGAGTRQLGEVMGIGRGII